MTFISKIIVGLLTIPVGLLIFQGIVLSTLNLFAFDQKGISVLLIGLCAYLGLIGFVALVRLTYSKSHSKIGYGYIAFSLVSGLCSLVLFLYIFSFAPLIVAFSAFVVTLAMYQVHRWYINKPK
ncbi:hypothetical protein [Pseudoalteromonas sp. PPB1]|uniref:hypothetical protein n=1 Tax=Pseudoalteromonas sp. PPB1 TaxID=2756136 RepID=UPI001891B890|nr:hypothetical protein [Pseudoalteromonas sp. PPB1]